MSADYLWAYIEPICFENGERVMSVAQIEDELRARVAARTNSDIDDAYFWCDGEAAIIGEVLANVEYVLHEYRDQAESIIGGVTIIHSGGMSHGDGPTEAFDALSQLSASMILELPFKNPVVLA